MKLIDLNLENLTVGSQVKTRGGFIWTHLGTDHWRDETSGLTWLPDVVGKFTHEQALELETSERRLPTKEEFEAAENHEIRSVIFNLSRSCRWSASVHPNFSDYAYDFYGGNGGIGLGNRGYGFDSVRCVGR